MLKLLVIADDLTGANDAGVQFAKRGVPVFVLTGIVDCLSAYAGDYQVLVVNTESRHLPPHEAAQRVRRVVAQGMKSGFTHFYKKTDSSLRGNIGSELEALMVTLGQFVLPFIPAFPKLKRTTRDGFQYVDDMPLHETAFARDPLEPIRESYIPAIIKQQTRIRSWVVKASEMAHETGIKIDEEGIYILDAATEDELQRAAKLLKENGLLKLTAGSAGFAQYLPDLLDLDRRTTRTPYKSGRMLVVSGSLNEVSLNQLSHAEANGFASVVVPPEALLVKEGAQSDNALTIINSIIALDKTGRDCILQSIDKRSDLQNYLEQGQRSGLDLKQIHSLIAENMGKITARVLERTSFSSLTVFGGDTLIAVARAGGWYGIMPDDEILPGVVASRVAGDTDGLLLITKAGGFGSEDVLLRIKEVLGSREK